MKFELLTFLALFVCFFNSVVFDELHFSKFLDRILNRTWFFDIHPPLGKLILAYGSNFFGYEPDPNFVIEKIGHEYPAAVKYVIPRTISASFSVATVPVTYLIARRLAISRIGGVFAAASVLTDFLGIIEGRLILMDSQLVFFCQVALLCALELWRTPRAQRMQFFAWLTLTGLFAGTALSIKHTALATPGLIAIVSFFGTTFLAEPLYIWECLYAAAVGLSVYVGSFYVMFNALIFTGGKYDKFMDQDFQKTLINSETYNPSVVRKPFWRLFSYLNWRMVASNAGIKKRHSWESLWYHWIVNWRGVLYFVKNEADGMKSRIYLIGNPVVSWLVLAFIAIFAICSIVVARYRSYFFEGEKGSALYKSMTVCIFLFGGWICNLLPYVLVDRAAFIYHYMPGLFYGQLLTAAVVDLLPRRIRLVIVTIAVATMLAALVYWSPWIYALPLTDAQNEKRKWLPRWN